MADSTKKKVTDIIVKLQEHDSSGNKHYSKGLNVQIPMHHRHFSIIDLNFDEALIEGHFDLFVV